jgi:1-acyl-sn-glycerol-3-phosphate acyltransferase
MQKKQPTVAYPRRSLIRHSARAFFRMLMPLAYKLDIKGQEKFPKDGPLLVVANHVAVMEAVLMAAYSPRVVELLGASDIPNDKINDIVMNAYGFIPVNRGHMDTGAMKSALGVLNQGGVIGLFPEGGTWAAGRMKPQIGVAWLSLHGNAAVVPIGFGGLAGALGQGLRLKRPPLSMNVGEPIPAAKIPPGRNRKEYLAEYATRVLKAITELVPAEDRQVVTIENERFESEVQVRCGGETWQSPPAELMIQHHTGLAHFLHSPVILKVYQKNLQRDVTALQDIALHHNPQAIADAVKRVLDYLENENAFFLSYRFGHEEAGNMKAGLEELLALAQWAIQSNHELKIVPFRRYYSLEQKKEIVQTKQDRYDHWM